MLMDLFNDYAHEFIELEETVETLTLEAEQIDLALQFSQQAHPDQKWSVYLQKLAQFGFEKWLQKREPRLQIHPPISSPGLETICQLQVGEFKVCIIPVNGFSEVEIMIPRAIVELPEFAAHFYVPIGVAEDVDLTAVLGFIPYNQLVNYQSQLQPLIDWTYAIPREWFNPDTDELLLHLQCLAPASIPLPAIPDSRQAELNTVKTQLETLLPQVKNRPLWQVLNWNQAKALLPHAELLNWLRNSQPSLAISELLQLLTQPAIELGTWLKNQLDDVSQSVAWQPLSIPVMRGSSLTVSPSISPVVELEDILSQLYSQYQIQVPTAAACRRESLSNDIQLYAITWLQSPQEWALLLIATTSAAVTSSPTMQWRISDEKQVLIERKLKPELGQTYLFTQIVGEIGEKFLMNLTIDENSQVTRVFKF
jgi:hypothetical protein